MVYCRVFCPNIWVRTKDDVIGKVIDEKKDTYQVIWFMTDKTELEVVGKDTVSIYPLDGELEDLKELKQLSEMMNDMDWIDDLEDRIYIIQQLMENPLPRHISVGSLLPKKTKFKKIIVKSWFLNKIE